MADKRRKFHEAKAKVDQDKHYTLDEAITLAKDVSYVKFDESIDMTFKLGVDPRHADQMVRGAVVLPHGIGKTVRVLVFATSDAAREATEAGADIVGGEELVEKVAGGFMDFDKVIAHPDMMKHVGKLGRVLGPRGLMPNPKVGTVTPGVANAVKETKAGRIEFRVDKAGVLHAPFGRRSFDETKLRDNANALFDVITRAKPSTAKGTYIKGVFVSTTMGPGIKVDPASFVAE
jgi:large subunit ribosomal protein L1